MQLREEVKIGEVRDVMDLLGVNGQCSVRDTAEALRKARSISKRELFAAMAMQGLVSSNAEYSFDKPGTWVECVARQAVQLAAALLAELKKATP